MMQLRSAAPRIGFPHFARSENRADPGRAPASPDLAAPQNLRTCPDTAPQPPIRNWNLISVALRHHDCHGALFRQDGCWPSGRVPAHKAPGDRECSSVRAGFVAGGAWPEIDGECVVVRSYGTVGMVRIGGRSDLGAGISGRALLVGPGETVVPASSPHPRSVHAFYRCSTRCGT